MSTGFVYAVGEEAQRQFDRLVVGMKTSQMSISGLEAALSRLRQDRARIARDLRVIEAEIMRVTEVLEASRNAEQSAQAEVCLQVQADCPSS